MKLKNIDGCFFINLDKRVDRLQHINNTLPFDSERVSAVNASTLQLTDEIKKLFPDHYYKFAKAEISCTLSHYYLWKKLIDDESAQNYLILEDDVCFKNEFVKFWNGRYADNIPADFDLIYLGGCQPYNKPHYKNVTESYSLYFNRIKNNDYFSENNHFWHMTTCSYIISKDAAKKACEWIGEYGFNSVIDHFMINFFNHSPYYGNPDNFYHINPLMANQIHEENDNTELDQNSDIRYAPEKFKKEDTHNKKVIFLDNNLKEANFIKDLFGLEDYEYITDNSLTKVYNNSIIVYSDFLSKDLSIYPDKYIPAFNKLRDNRIEYFKKAANKNCILIHLADIDCVADTSHYKYFKNVFRQFYREDCDHDCVSYIPLGYKG
jgi:GR25 family glycosyltransferase involved in LPS biosynthesis